METKLLLGMPACSGAENFKSLYDMQCSRCSCGIAVKTVKASWVDCWTHRRGV